MQLSKGHFSQLRTVKIRRSPTSAIMSNNEESNVNKNRTAENRKKEAAEQQVYCPFPKCVSSKRDYRILRTVRDTYAHLASKHKIG